MKKPAAQTVLKWLRENGIPLGALTSHDTAALFAAVQIAELWARGDADNQHGAAAAFQLVVCQMQTHTRYMAFHAVAHVADWCHRGELWAQANLSFDWVIGRPECAFGPGKQYSQGGAA